jgi:hypothetical protein
VTVWLTWKAFFTDHQTRDQLTGDADEPTPTGYRLWISCPCGVTFERLMGRRVPQYTLVAHQARRGGRLRHSASQSM